MQPPVRGMCDGPARRSDGAGEQDQAAVAIRPECLDSKQDGGMRASGTANSEIEKWQKRSRGDMG